MTAWRHGISGKFRTVIFVLPLILVALVLVVFLPPDGGERASWAQFIGRFHPLAVHFPIAFLLLVPILELLGFNESYRYLRRSAGFVLGFATLGATVAAILGWFLARNGGYSGPLLAQHMWGGISLAAVCWLCWLLRTSSGERGPDLVYVVALATGVALVTWTGYRGGQLTSGENHLTEHMPVGLRHVLGISDTNLARVSRADANTFYGARVQPIFEARCVSCHGPSKRRANLRLDSYAALMRGGKDGPVLQAGNIQNSDLVRRITLPPGHDDFMPKESQRPLSSDQVKLIELWIGAGASTTLAVNAIKDAPTGSSPSTGAAEVEFDEIDSATVTRLRAAEAAAVAQLQRQFPNILDYESRGSADLRLNASILGPRFGDADLAAFTRLAEHITVADFSRTSITDRSAAVIGSMRRLRVLRLMHTGITDATVGRLGGLDQLESLSVFDTQITSAALPTIEKLPKLAHCYAGQTGITAGTPVPKALEGKLIF